MTTGEHYNDEGAQIDEFIRSIPALIEREAVIESTGTSATARSGDYDCFYESFSETRRYDQLAANAANSNVLWPGALVQGDAAITGVMSEIVHPRRPSRFSISLHGLGQAAAQMQRPSLSSFRNKLAEVLDSDLPPATAADVSFAIEEVHSEKQLEVALGFGFKLAGEGVESSFDFSDETIRSRFIVKYVQKYYTVDLDQPERPSALWERQVSLEDVRASIEPDTPPLFVSSITYGRLVVFSFESTYSAQEMHSSINFALGIGAGAADAGVAVDHEEMLSQSSISAYVVGGDAQQATTAIRGVDALKDFLVAGATFSHDSPGAPIAYKLSYLRNNRPARLSLSSDYEILHCERVSRRVMVRFRGIRYSSGGETRTEPYGSISVEAVGPDGLASEPQTLLARSPGEWIPINLGETWPGGTSSIVAEAALDVVPQPGSAIVVRAELMDHDGGEFIIDWNPDDPIGNETMNIPFEAGWSGERVLHMSGDGQRLDLLFELEPL